MKNVNIILKPYVYMETQNTTKNTKTIDSIKNILENSIKKIDSFLINNKILGENNGAANSN